VGTQAKLHNSAGGYDGDDVGRTERYGGQWCRGMGRMQLS